MNDRNIEREGCVVDYAETGSGTAAMLVIALTALVVLGGAVYVGWSVVKGLWR